VYDRYAVDYYSNSEYENLQGPEISGNRVIRGGSWHSGHGYKRVYNRKGLISGWNDFAVGFRCAMDGEEQER
jgi:formylglycine-generating enzyme required for sulfatase activity